MPRFIVFMRSVENENVLHIHSLETRRLQWVKDYLRSNYELEGFTISVFDEDDNLLLTKSANSQRFRTVKNEQSRTPSLMEQDAKGNGVQVALRKGHERCVPARSEMGI